MEGDVVGLAERPQAEGEEQDKWNAWKRHTGVSRTEAKRLYIELLIETMHDYASDTPDARELVSELEFVWNQIKNNSPAATSSSGVSYGLQSPPIQGPGAYPASPMPTPGLGLQMEGETRELDPVEEMQRAALQAGLRSPEMEQELFVDAPDSQEENQAEELLQDAKQDELVSPSEGVSPGQKESLASPLSPSLDQQQAPLVSSFPFTAASSTQSRRAPPSPPIERTKASALLAKYLPSRSLAPPRPVSPSPSPPATNTLATGITAAQAKWHKRIENSLIRLTTEVTALREQLDYQQQQNNPSYSALLPFRPSISRSASGGIASLKREFSWENVLQSLGSISSIWVAAAARHVAIDAAIVAVVWLYLRKRQGWSEIQVAHSMVALTGRVMALFGPVVGVFQGAKARLPGLNILKVMDPRWLLEWLRAWGALLLIPVKTLLNNKKLRSNGGWRARTITDVVFNMKAMRC
jgi:hypothetical protein